MRLLRNWCIVVFCTVLWVALSGPRPVAGAARSLVRSVFRRLAGKRRFATALIYYALLVHAEEKRAAGRQASGAARDSRFGRAWYRLRSLAKLPHVHYSTQRLAAYVIAAGEADRLRLVLTDPATTRSAEDLRILFDLDYQEFGYEAAGETRVRALEAAASHGTTSDGLPAVQLSSPDVFDLALQLFAVAVHEADLEFAADLLHRFIVPNAGEPIRIARAKIARGDLEIARNNPARAVEFYRSALVHLDPTSRQRFDARVDLERRAFSGMLHGDLLQGDDDGFIRHCLFLLERPDHSYEVCRNLCFFLFREGRLADLERLRAHFRQVGPESYFLIAEYFVTLSTTWASHVTAGDENPPAADKPDRTRSVIVFPVWGTAYVDHLLTIAIPALLSEGNIPAFARTHDVSIAIYTDAAGARTIPSSPSYRKLLDHVPCDIVVMPESLFDTKFSHIWGWKISILSLAHAMALSLAKSRHAGLIFWAPDVVVSRGYLAALGELIDAGYRLIFCSHTRLQMRSALTRLHAMHDRDAGTLSVDAATLDSLVRTHMAYPLRAYFYDDGIWTSWPHCLIWRNPGGGFAMHAFHHHPLYLSAETIQAFDGSPFFSNDSDLIVRLNQSVPESKRKVMQGSEGVVACQLTDDEPPNDLGSRFDPDPKLTARQIAHFGYRQSALARWLFRWPLVAGTEQAEAFKIPSAAVDLITRRMAELEAAVGERKYIAGYWLPTVPRIGP